MRCLTPLLLLVVNACSPPSNTFIPESENKAQGCGVAMTGFAQILRFETAGVPSGESIAVYNFTSDAGMPYPTERNWEVSNACLHDEGLVVGAKVRVTVTLVRGNGAAYSQAVSCPQPLFAGLTSPSCAAFSGHSVDVL